MTGSSDTEVTTMSFRFKMMSVTSSDDTGDRVELVERVVEPGGRDRCAGDRRQEGAAKRVAERVAEARLERTDGETLAMFGLLTESFDGGALHDEHWCQGPFNDRGFETRLRRT